jgi:subtilisin family serine protease
MNKNIFFKEAIVLVIVFLMISSVVVSAYKIEEMKLDFEKDLDFVNNQNLLNNIIRLDSSAIFSQLPAPPADPMPLFWSSYSPLGWRCQGDFWEVTSPICSIHWWGVAWIYDSGKIISSDPEGMTFNIVFYENNNGRPGEMVQTYVNMLPSITDTGIIYTNPDIPNEFFELFYFEVDLDPSCELSAGWVSIQAIYSPTDSGFSWIESLEGNKELLQYGYGQWLNDTYDFAFMLTDSDGAPVPDLNCDGSLSWNDIALGGLVNGSFSVENCGDPDSILHWKIDSYPEWGVNWTFTPSANFSTVETGWTTVNVQAIAPDKSNKKYSGAIKIINAVDPSDYHEIPIVLKTSVNQIVNKPSNPNSLPSFTPTFTLNKKYSKGILNNDFFDSDTIKEEFVPGEIIVKFNDETAISSRSVKKLNEKYQVSSVENIFGNNKDTTINNIYLLKVPEESDIFSIVQDYLLDANVVYAEPNYIAQICTFPNDPAFDLQWALHNTGRNGGTPNSDIQASRAWDFETGDENIIITISDTGVDWDHPDLISNMWSNSDEILDGNDTDGNGYIDDIRGWDFVNNDNNPIDDQGHGTSCAGIASADTNNNIGMAGICWNCTIMPVKGLDEYGYGTYVDLANGIVYSADNDADIISMSWSGSSSSSIMENAVDYAYSKGVVLVAAASNSHTDRKYYPAANSKVIGVAATYYNDEKMYFSNYGSWVDVAAPGYDIYTTANGDGYQSCFWGTSASTPHVSGVIGIMLSKDPTLEIEEIRTILRSTTDDVKSNQYIGTGRINIYEALQRDSTPIVSLNSSLDETMFLSDIYINGTASGSIFENYSVFYGYGEYPYEWTLIDESSTPVENGLLALWDPPADLKEERCTLRLVVYDSIGQISEDRAIVIVNLPPNTPSISGPSPGKVGSAYTYSFVTTDLNGDDVYYYVDWGDGNVEEWIGPSASGETIKYTYVWAEKGTYTVKVKAKDVYGCESDWGILAVEIGKNKFFNFNLFTWLFDHFPVLSYLNRL